MLGIGRRGTVAAESPSGAIEDFGVHRARLCAATSARQERDGVKEVFADSVAGATAAVGCGAVVLGIKFLRGLLGARSIFWARRGARRAARRSRSIADPTRNVALASLTASVRARAAVAYGPSRSRRAAAQIWRRLAFATTAARPGAASADGPTAGPVPLHRWRLWGRVQRAALIADALSAASGVAHDPLVLRRAKRTPALRGMNPRQRHDTVRAAFAVEGRIELDTSCWSRRLYQAPPPTPTRALLRRGLVRSPFLCWARVVGDTPIDKPRGPLHLFGTMAKVEITKAWCPYCVRAMKLLHQGHRADRI